MKNILKYSALLTIGALVCFAVVSFASNDKPIKYVSMLKVYEQSDLKITYDKKLSDFEEQSNSKLLKMDEEIKQLQIDGASPAEVNQLRAELQKTRELLSNEYQTRSQKYQEEIWVKINRSVEKYGKEHGYKFILGATGNGGIMYADDSEDITKEIIAHINQ